MLFSPMVCLKQCPYILGPCKQSSMLQSLIKEEIKKIKKKQREKKSFPSELRELHTAEADGMRLIV